MSCIEKCRSTGLRPLLPLLELPTLEAQHKVSLEWEYGSIPWWDLGAVGGRRSQRQKPEGEADGWRRYSISHWVLCFSFELRGLEVRSKASFCSERMRVTRRLLVSSPVKYWLSKFKWPSCTFFASFNDKLSHGDYDHIASLTPMLS